MESMIGRRSFLKTASAAAAGFTIVKPKSAFGYPANSTIQMGIIGCGLRGTKVVQSFMKETDTCITAIAEAHYRGGVFIKGENEWDSGVPRGTAEEISQLDRDRGAFRGALADADPNIEKEFIESIKSGNYMNEAKSAAESNLTGILARTAAYSSEEITWDEMLASDEKWDPMVDETQFDRK